MKKITFLLLLILSMVYSQENPKDIPAQEPKKETAEDDAEKKETEKEKSDSIFDFDTNVYEEKNAPKEKNEENRNSSMADLIFGKEDYSKKQVDPAFEERKKRKNSFQILGGGGVDRYELDIGRNKVGKAVYYRDFGELHRFGFGIRNTYTEIESRSKNFSLALLPFIYNDFQRNPSTINSLFFVSGIFNSTFQETINLAHISADYNFHIQKNKTFDPYLGVSLLAGICGSSCNSTAYELRFGMNFHIQNFFLSLEYSSLNSKLYSKLDGTFNLSTDSYLAGFGMKF
jgi:hypothetical protein